MRNPVMVGFTGGEAGPVLLDDGAALSVHVDGHLIFGVTVDVNPTTGEILLSVGDWPDGRAWVWHRRYKIPVGPDGLPRPGAYEVVE